MGREMAQRADQDLVVADDGIHIIVRRAQPGAGQHLGDHHTFPAAGCCETDGHGGGFLD
jgi:hypothetical protein